MNARAASRQIVVIESKETRELLHERLDGHAAEDPFTPVGGIVRREGGAQVDVEALVHLVAGVDEPANVGARVGGLDPAGTDGAARR